MQQESSQQRTVKDVVAALSQIQEQIVGVDKIMEELGEVVKLIPLERIQQCSMEIIVAAPVMQTQGRQLKWSNVFRRSRWRNKAWKNRFGLYWMRVLDASMWRNSCRKQEGKETPTSSASWKRGLQGCWMKKESILKTSRATLGGVARDMRVAVTTQWSVTQPLMVQNGELEEGKHKLEPHNERDVDMESWERALVHCVFLFVVFMQVGFKDAWCSTFACCPAALLPCLFSALVRDLPARPCRFVEEFAFSVRAILA